MMRLPIDNYKETILANIEKTNVMLITAETGAGKSTRVPQMLKEAGYDVVVTEPRRLAAVKLAQIVAEEASFTLGEEVGYATAFEQCYSKETKILYATDGLQLIRQLHTRNDSTKKVLIIDEVHEWNLNIEVLIAWCKMQLELGFDTKVILMSATMDISSVDAYFGDKVFALNVEGRTFPVTFEQSSLEVAEEVALNIEAGRNILVFVPGKPEIELTIEEIKNMVSCDKFIVLPLHGELTFEQQSKCFESYSVPKVIVATNVAQTSITVPDIDVVIDTGKEKIVETKNGVEGLYLKDCSRADIFQRKGRAGRVKEGKYILCSGVEINRREEYSVPEIMRLNLDQVVLRLASIDIDAETVEFFHQPSKDAIKMAKEVLINLGALNSNGKITDIGIKMSKLPVSARAARMLVEAEERNCVKDVIVAAAIFENGSLLDFRAGGRYTDFTSESRSDLLAEILIYNSISQTRVDFKEKHINSKVFFRVKEYVKKLNQIFNEEIEKEEAYNLNKDEHVTHVIYSFVSGMADLMHVSDYFDDYRCGSFTGKLNNKSCVNKYRCDCFIGRQNTFETKDKYGFKMRLNVITMVTVMRISEVEEIAPQMFERKPSYVSYNEDIDKVEEAFDIYYKGNYVKTEVLICSNESKITQAMKEYEETKKLRQKEIENSMSERIPNTIEVNGKEYTLYSNSWSIPYIYMEPSELFKLEKTQFVFTFGKVQINCLTLKNTDIVMLKNQVKAKLFSQEIDNIRDSLREKKIEGYDSFLNILKELEEVTISLTHYGVEETRTYYKYLSIKNNKISVEIKSDKEKADTATNEALRYYLGLEIKKRFPEKAFYFKINGKPTLTNKGLKAKSSFDNEKIMVIREITKDNFEESLEYLEIAYDEALSMLDS